MDIKNKNLVSQLLAALNYVDIVKRDINNLNSSATHKDYQLLGNHIVSLIQSSPKFNERLIDLLDTETNVIEGQLKEL